MFLEKLEIQGFKSFAHKTTLAFKKRGKINQGITAIVGPNGSGKSNVADAVRWVLGEQSLKLLRGKKSEDVIFSGSNTKTRLGFAEVALFLNNEDRSTDIAYTQVVIKRRVYRDGTSEYYINNAKTRLADIQLLLAQANFGGRSYSVIGQGMADSILSATPHERKQFFDEATGVKQYQIKREHAIAKIEATQENLVQARGLLREITPRMRSLERQIEKLAKRETLEKELRSLQLIHFGTHWHAITEELSHARSEKKHISEKHLERTKKLAALQGSLDELATQRQHNDNHAYEHAQEAHIAALQQKQQLEAQRAGLVRERSLMAEQQHAASPVNTADLLHAAKKQEAFFKELAAADSLDVFKRLQQTANGLLSSLTGILHPKKDEKDKHARRQHAYDQHMRQLDQDIAAAATMVAEKQKALAAIRTSESRTTSGVIDMQKKYQTLQTELNQLTEKRSAIDIQLARAETKKEDLEQTLKRDVAHDLHQRITHYTPSAEDKHQDHWPQIAKTRHELEMIGGIDTSVNAEFAETKERFDFLSAQVEDLSGALEKTKHALRELDMIIEKEFGSAFAKIEKGFNEYFSILFGGGKAQLVLHKESALDALHEDVAAELSALEQEQLAHTFTMGIEIAACPPNKKVSAISMLSGGERALTSIALICAIIHANPSPFVVLDEMDAALDEANSVRFAEILERLSHETQFIAITHNRATMEKGDIIYGVTMGKDGVSKLLSVDLEKAMENAGQA